MIICWWNQGTTATASITSEGNSRDAAIDAGQTFTGLKESNSYEDVMVAVKTDQNGTLYLELSQDGVNWDTSLSFVYDTSRISPPHILVKGNRYFRVRFKNDSASNQTYFRLQTYYGNFNKLTAPINGTLAENFDASVVRTTDYHYEVAMGKRQGRSTVNKFGNNTDIDSASGDEIIASWGGTFDPTTDVITTAQTFTITYNNATDGAGQTGATSILITYIDENFLTQSEIHTLGNTGSDVTTFTGLGINRVVVLSNGGAGWNVNDITIVATIDTTTQAEIEATSSVTHQCIFHTQINHNLLLDWLLINVLKVSGGGASPKVNIRAYSYSRVTQTRYEVFHHKLDTDVENSLELAPKQPFVLGGREVFYLVCSTDKDNTEVDARFSGIEERIL